MILLPVTRLSQPSYAKPPDDAVFLFNGASGGFDLANNIALTGGYLPSVSDSGIGHITNTLSVTSEKYKAINNRSVFTVLGVIKRAGTNAGRLFRFEAASGYGWDVEFSYWSAFEIRLSIMGRWAASGGFSQNIPCIADDLIYFCATIDTLNLKYQLYSKGSFVASGAMTNLDPSSGIGNETSRIFSITGSTLLVSVLTGIRSDAKELSANPWLLFPQNDSLYFPILVGGGDVSASGSVASVSLSVPVGVAAGSALALGDLSGLNLSAPTGSASVVANGLASGDLSALSLSVPVGVAAGSSLASGDLSALSLSAPTGSASVVANGLASGALAALSLSVPVGVGSGSSLAVGDLSALSLFAPDGLAAAGGVGLASGALSALSLSAPVGVGSGSSLAVGDLSSVSLSSPEGSAQSLSGAVGMGSFSALSLLPPECVAVGNAIAVCSLPALSLFAPLGFATNGAIPDHVADDTYTIVGKKRQYNLIGRKRSYTIWR
jgi:hypothetical protein